MCLEEGPDDKKDSELRLIESSEDTFEDGNFKNRLVQIKGLNQLFSGESNGNSEAVSEHRSEPQINDQVSDDTQSNLKISEMLRKKMELRLQLNYEDEPELVQEPAIISNNNNLIAAVTKPTPTPSSL